MVKLGETSRTKTNQTTNHPTATNPNVEILSEIVQSVARTCPHKYIKIMKLTDLIIARDRLENEIQNNPASQESALTLHMAGQMEAYAGAWSKHVLKNPTNDKPFVDILTPLCQEAIKANPETAGLFDTKQILYGARALRLTAIVTTLKRVAAGEFVWRTRARLIPTRSKQKNRHRCRR